MAKHLPLPIPTPLRAGRPALGYPWHWSVCAWLEGEPVLRVPPRDLTAAATTLGRFLAALHRPAPNDAPTNPYRGVPLTDRTARLHAALDTLGEAVDRRAVHALWSELVTTPAWNGPPMWLHGDLHPGNILVADGEISAVIDFGDITAGDPATDLAVAWMMFPASARAAFRAAAGKCDDHTWHRARAWALALGLAYISGSADNPEFSGLGERVVAAALRDA